MSWPVAKFFSVPDWARLSVDVSTARECQTKWGNEPLGRLHPRGWGGDPSVLKVGETYHMWLNFPGGSSKGTQIAHCTSLDGTAWSNPKVVLTAEGNPEIFGYETPGRPVRLGPDLWLHSVLAKHRLADGSRWDQLEFWTSETLRGAWEHVPINMEILFPWEERFISNRTFKLTGGLQEPAPLMFQGTLFCAYTAHSYANGNKPSTGMAYLDMQTLSWQRWPEPVIPESAQPDLLPVRCPDSSLPLEYGFLCLYQHNGGTGESELHYRFSYDLRHWSQPEVLLTREASPLTSRRVVGPSLCDGKLYWWGDQSKEDGNDSTIMVANVVGPEVTL